jgi:hypothetical protein
MTSTADLSIDHGEQALQGNDLSFGYGGKLVFDDISLHVNKREIVCLLGGSTAAFRFSAHRCSRRIRARRWCFSKPVCCRGWT